jgi:hypothetical protein
MCHSCHGLRKQIQFLRKALIETGITKGLKHPETIKYSQMLDELIFRFQSKCK